MSEWQNLQRDYERALGQSGYSGQARKIFHTLTSPSFQAVLGYRLCRMLYLKRVPLLGAVIQRMTEVWTGVSIPPEAKIGPGLLVLHFGGIVIHARAVIGNDLTLHHGVTIGNRKSGGGCPQIGNRVSIGVGAKVLGEVHIGDNAEIGANAVVLHDVPAGSVAVGIPARIVRVKTQSESVKSD